MKRALLSLLLALLLVSCAPEHPSAPSTSEPPNSEPCESEPLTAPPFTLHPTDLTLSPALRAERDALQDAHGITIAMGNEIRPLADYTTAPMHDEGRLRAGLAVLDEVLSLYPSGFLASLAPEGAQQTVICLTGALTAKEADAIGQASGLFTVAGGEVLLVFDLSDQLLPLTVHHELCHAIEARLLSLGMGDMLSLPDDPTTDADDYLSSYLGYEGRTEYTFFGESDPMRVYFFDAYCKTFPAEDRAVSFAYLMTAPTSPAFASPHIRAKLECYFAALREGFSLVSTPVWEQRLDEIGQKAGQK